MQCYQGGLAFAQLSRGVKNCVSRRNQGDLHSSQGDLSKPSDVVGVRLLDGWVLKEINTSVLQSLAWDLYSGDFPVLVKGKLALTMGDKSSKRSRDGPGHGTKKKHKSSHRDSESKRKRRHSAHDSVRITDDDPNDDDLWVEKNIDMDGEGVRMPSVSLRGPCLCHCILSSSQRTYRPQRASS